MKRSRVGGAAVPGRLWLAGTEARPTGVVLYKLSKAFKPQPSDAKALSGTVAAEMQGAFGALESGVWNAPYCC